VLTVSFVGVRTFTLERCFSPHTAEVCDFGMFAEHLSAGLMGPPPVYTPMAREAGSLVFGAFCSPLFVGDAGSFHALRLCSVMWHALLLTVFGTLAWHLGRWPGAVAFGALWALAPPAIVKLQQMGWASHVETTLFGGVAVWALSRAVVVAGGWRSAAWALLAGLAAGGACAFAYAGASMAAAVAVTALAVRLWRKGWGAPTALVIGMALGVLPAVLLRVLTYDAALTWTSARGDPLHFLMGWPAEFWVRAQVGWFNRMLEMVSRTLPEAWGFVAAPGARTTIRLGGLYLVSLLVLAGIASTRGRRAVQEAAGPDPGRRVIRTAAISSVLLHVLLCVCSGLSGEFMRDRYVLPLAPYLMLLASGAAAVGWRRGPWVANWPVPLVVASGVVVLALGAGELARIAACEPAGYRERNLIGHRHTASLSTHLWNMQPHELLRLAADHPCDRRELATIHGDIGSGRGQRMGAIPQAWWHAVVRESWGQPPAAQPFFWEGVGRNVLLHGAISADQLPPAFHALRDRFWDPADPLAARVCFGMGTRHTNRGSPGFEVSWRDLRKSSSPEMLPALCAGVAASEMRERYGLRVSPADGVWEAWIPGCQVSWLAMGIGMQLARETRPGASWPPGEPLLSWWFGPPHVHGAPQAFRCGYDLELDLLERLQSPDWQLEHDLPDPLLDCLRR